MQPQPDLSQRLGLTRAVVLHVDDLGSTHGANRAYLDLAARGLVSCGSVMVPCHWFREIAEAAMADPALDLGVHLTLTSEWLHYRWAPISTTNRASGLIDDDGYFWRDVASLRRHLVPEAAEAELRAQIERALAAGMVPTHIDAHMAAAMLPSLLEVHASSLPQRRPAPRIATLSRISTRGRTCPTGSTSGMSGPRCSACSGQMTGHSKSWTSSVALGKTWHWRCRP